MRIAIVDDEEIVRSRLQRALAKEGFEVETFGTGELFLEHVKAVAFDLILLDVVLPGANGIEVLRQVKSRYPKTEVILITGFASIDAAIEATKLGAFHYVSKPFKLDEIRHLVQKALEHKKLVEENSDLRARLESCEERPEMIGVSPVMLEVFAVIDKVAPLDCNVIIQGESGTGKELVAKAIHAASSRRSKPMVSLNCPVLSAQLMESELFGHERGAFTGADTARTGRFELADGGSILLDEVTEIELVLQAKLLRVLQERSFERVGSSQTIAVDVRVLATTNRDLAAEVSAGRFRQDLYYRLAVVPLHVPPLRQRKEDIPELMTLFLRRSAVRLGREPVELDRSTIDLLMHYDWPGNVRELENVITRLSVLGADGSVGADELRRWLLLGPEDEGVDATADFAVGLSLEAMERKLIEATLDHFDGHREKTAKALGIGVRTLSGKLRQYGYAPREKSLARAGR